MVTSSAWDGTTPFFPNRPLHIFRQVSRQDSSHGGPAPNTARAPPPPLADHPLTGPVPAYQFAKGPGAWQSGYPGWHKVWSLDQSERFFALLCCASEISHRASGPPIPDLHHRTFHLAGIAGRPDDNGTWGLVTARASGHAKMGHPPDGLALPSSNPAGLWSGAGCRGPP